MAYEYDIPRRFPSEQIFLQRNAKLQLELWTLVGVQADFVSMSVFFP